MRTDALKGQAALVTGANSGIGECVARSFAAAGARVAINYVTHPEAAEKIVDDIRKAGGEAIALRADVANEGEVKTMYAEMFKAFGTIDILCANAGIQDDAPFVEMSLEQWNRVIGINLTGQFLCAREAARRIYPPRGAARNLARRRENNLHELGASGNPVGRPR